MLTTIGKAAQGYYDTLPTDIGKTMAMSAALSFTSRSIFSVRPEGDFTGPLFSAVFASAASLVHALVQPFFRWAFGSEHNSWPVELAKMTIVQSATYCAFFSFVPVLRTSLVAQSQRFLCFSWNLFIALNNRAQASNSVYISP